MITRLRSDHGLPPGSYGLLEYYCPDPACHCRRVMINVVEKQDRDQILAYIDYSFDPDGKGPGPFLDPLNPQSPYAEKLLDLVKVLALDDPLYLARLERHYNIVKQAASDPRHPAYERLQEVLADPITLFSVLHRGAERQGPAAGEGKRRRRRKR